MTIGDSTLKTTSPAKTDCAREKSRRGLRTELPALASLLEKIAATFRVGHGALYNTNPEPFRKAAAAARALLNHELGNFGAPEFGGTDGDVALNAIAYDLDFLNGAVVVDEVGDFVHIAAQPHGHQRRENARRRTAATDQERRRRDGAFLLFTRQAP